MQPLVSILIPAHNSQRLIAETIQSALAQSWPRKEIIIVDDGSTDETLAVARRFASDSVRVVSQPNQGAAAARNHAFSLCQGDYIQWLDADDLLAPDKISRQMAALSRGANPRILLSGPWGRFLYRARKAQFQPTCLWGDLSAQEWLLRRMENDDAFMQTSTWLVSRELSEAAGPWDTRLSLDDDGEYFCRILLASAGTRFVPEANTYYRLTSGSLSQVGRSARKMESQLLSCKLHVRYVRSLGETERSRAACVKYLQKYVFHFYFERPDLVKQFEALAAELGGRLELPRFSGKYAWIQQALGWSAAKQAQVRYNNSKWALIRWWDETLFNLERKSARSAAHASQTPACSAG